MHNAAASSPSKNELECPRCGAVAVNRDFCACGEYLSWELTLADAAPAVAAPEVRPAAPAEPRRSTLLTLRDPAREDDPSAAIALTVAPGAEVVLVATVRNQGEIVDTFDIRVDGLPEAWWSVSSPTVFLNPWGSSGDYQQDVLVRLHPPRTPEARAGVWPVRVVVRSRSRGNDVAWAPAGLAIEPFQQLVMHAGPQRRGGRRGAAFDVTVVNQGNGPQEIAVRAADDEAACPILVTPERALVPVGAAASAVVRVRVPKPILCGRPVDRQVDISHAAGGIPQRVTFRQKPWVPVWVPVVATLFAVALATVLFLRRHVEVPKLKGDTLNEAVVVIHKRHLQLGRTTYATAPKDVPAGTVINQEPAAGDDLAKGELVDITLAAPAKLGAVPPVNGLTLAAAADVLTAAHFDYDPQPSSAGNDWIVIRQQPTPGQEQHLGAKITLAVQAPPTPTPTASGADAGGAASSGAATSGTSAATGSAPGGATTLGAGAAGKAAAAAAGAAGGAGGAAGAADGAGGAAGGAGGAAGAAGGAAGADASRAAKAAPARAAAAALPAALLFARDGRLFETTGTKTKPLTSAKYTLATPVKTDEGFVAADGAALVRVSADGKTVEPLVTGFEDPAYSSPRGLLAAIAGGKLCALDPQDPVAACGAGTHFSHPGWAPDGTTLLALKPNQLVTFTAAGSDAAQWHPTSAYKAKGLTAAAFVGNARIAVLAGHLSLLARRAHGRFELVRDFPSVTGQELAASGHELAVRDGNAISVLDIDAAKPRPHKVGRGLNPSWATP